MSKLERLLNLTAALLDADRPLLASELRERLEGYPEADASFRRAFERDKDDLRTLGIPLTVEPLPGTDPPVDGYRIRRNDYAGDAPDLDPDELASLHLATNLVRLTDSSSDDPFWKLGGRPDTDDAPQPVAEIGAGDDVARLIGAAGDRQVLTFDYSGSRREVEPYRVVFTRGHWYLSGFDRSRDDERLFRVDRIEGSIDAGERDAFARPADLPEVSDAPGWELGDRDPIAATLHIDAHQAVLARHHLRPHELTDHDDGSVTANLSVRNVDAFLSFVLTFLDGAELLEPTDMRAELVARMEALT